jgi:predicted cupin superfamily sugar epimerase
MHPRAAQLIATLGLQPHPEGGFYRELFRSATVVTPTDDRGPRAALTTIYFLLTAETWSRWHQVDSDEVWHLYEGGPLELFELDPSTHSLERHHLAPVDGGEQSPVHVVAAGRWQAARSLGDYTLVGCTVGPGFDFADFRLLAHDQAAAAAVRDEWPDLTFLV